MLNAPVGAFLNLLSILRSVIFLFKKKLNPMHPLWLCAFIGAYAVSYVLTFTIFQKEPTLPNLLLKLLLVIGSISLFVAFRFDSVKWTRRLGLINGPAWLVYNIFYLSVGGIISGKQAYEQSTELLTVGGKKGYKASCLEKAGDYVKIEYAKTVTALSLVYTPTREYFGLGAVETDRFAVIPYVLSGLLFEQYNPLRREILYAVLKKRQKNYIQTGISGVQPYLYKRAEGFALMLVNYTVNCFEKTAFSTDIPFQKLLCVSRTGELHPVPFERTENAVVAYLPLAYLSTATLLLLP